MEDANSLGTVASRVDYLTRDWHVEHNVLQRSCLRYLPMNAARDICLISLDDVIWHLCQVDDEIANLAVELILVDIPFISVCFRDVYVCIDQSYAREVRGAFDCRRVLRIANKLSIIVS